MEATAQEKLIQFIHNLTDAECKMIVSLLAQENTPLAMPIAPPQLEGWYLIATPEMNKTR